MDINEIRDKYPQYKDMSDFQLAEGLRHKYYGDVSAKGFYPKIGIDYTPETDYQIFKANYKPLNIADIASSIPGGVAQAATDIYGGVKTYASNLIEKPGETTLRTIPTAVEGMAKGGTNLLGLGLQTANYAKDILKENIGSKNQEEEIRDAYNRHKLQEKINKAQEEVNIPGSIPETANALSYVLDPTVLASGGIGALGRGALETSLGKAVVEHAASPLLKGGETIAQGAKNVFDIPRTLKSSLEKATIESPQNFPLQATNAIGSPTLSTVSAVTTPIALGADVADKTAQLSGSILENLTQSSQISSLERIARDTTKAPWMRKAAQALDASGGSTIGALGYDIAQGVGIGGTTGFGIGLATGQNSEDIGKSIGTGGFLGGVSHPIGSLLGKDNRLANEREADLNKYIESHEGDLSNVPKPILQAAADREILGGGQLKIRFEDPENLQKDFGSSNSMAMQNKDGTTSIFLNKDQVINNPKTIDHEFGHAIYNSPIIDKTSVNSTLLSILGEDGIKVKELEYAKRSLESQGVENPSESQIAGEVNNLKTTAGWDYAFKEIFADSIMDQSAGKSLSNLKKMGGFIQGFPESQFAQKILSAKKQFLESVGVKFADDGSGKLLKNTIKDPRIQSMARDYIDDFQKFRSGIQNAKIRSLEDSGARVPSKELLAHPATRDFLTKTDDKGRIVLKTDKELKAEDLNRKKELQDIVNALPEKQKSLTDQAGNVLPDDIAFGKRLTDKGIEISGKVGAADLIKNAKTFSPEMKISAKLAEEAMSKGDVMDFWYRNAIKNRGNVKVSKRQAAPWTMGMSKNENLFVRAIDLNDLDTHVRNLQSQDKLGIFNNDLNQFYSDFEKLRQNHEQGNLGSNGIGDGKYQFFRGLFNFTDQYGNIAPSAKNGFIKAFRIDRMANPKLAGKSGYGIDYYKMKTNQLPIETK